MSILQTVLVFVGIPAAVVAVITGLAYAGSSRPGKRYRPGRPFDFTPVWFLSAPEPMSGVDGRAALPGARRAELTAGETAADNAVAAHGDTGGASDRW